jgi:alpha-N-arabinofuranosidase
VGRYRNPVLPGCHPDPSICRVGGEFFLVTSTFEYLPGLPIHVSANLVDWTPIGHAVHRPEQLDFAGLPGSCGLFAPTIRHHDGLFHVVCTVVGPDDGAWAGRTGHFVVTASDASGPWSDPVWIDGVGGFDPSLTFDGGRVWLTGTQPEAEPQWPGQTGVWLVELDPATFQPLGEPAVIWHGALVGAVWAEGPHILPRPGGGWMLVAAEGGTARDHAVSVAYADTIAGPYIGDLANPRLTHRDLGGSATVAAVGHADLVDDAAGRTWATVLATRPVEGRDGLLGRQTHLVPVAYEDGRPVFAPGEARVRAVVDADGVPDQRAFPSVHRDDFDAVAGLDPAWNGVGRHPSAFADLTSRPGRLRLKGGAEPTTLGPQSFLGRRLPDTQAEVTIAVELPGGAEPVRGGLLLRTSEKAHLAVSIDGTGTVRCELTAGGVRSTLAERSGVGSPARLAVRIRDLDAEVLVEGAPLTTADLSGLVPDPARGFVGVWVGPYVVGRADSFIDVDVAEVEVLR